MCKFPHNADCPGCESDQCFSMNSSRTKGICQECHREYEFRDLVATLEIPRRGRVGIQETRV